MAKVKTGVSRLTSAALVEKSNHIVTSMTGNLAYASLQGLLPAITTASNNLAAANAAAAGNGGKLEHETKRKCHAILRALIVDLAPQVQTASGGDAETIVSAGFDTVKPPAQQPLPGEPQHFEAVYTGFEGAVKFRWAAEKVAAYYQLEMLREDGTYEVAATTKRSNFTLHGLVSGRQYTFRVYAMGTAGVGPACESINAKAA